MAAFTDYAPGGSAGSSNAPETKSSYWSLSKLKRAYLDYVGSKREELEEQQNARRYRHGAQYTDAQVRVLNARRQPVVTFNRVGRKIDGIVGLVEKLRQDPKAFPRTPKHEQGAELSTAVLNFVLDQQDWKAKSPLVAESGATDGIGGIELNLIQGEREGDYEIEFDAIDASDFFYDPRSFRLDFSDARYMGIGKWMDIEEAAELYPEKEDEIRNAANSASELTADTDRNNRWFTEDVNGVLRQVRVVDLWYLHKGKWCYATFTGTVKLIEGESYLYDENEKTMCKYIVYSAAVDHDGDRYGFVRNLRSAQDEINQRRSKGLHELNTRRIIGEIGAFDDVETARREAARPDGVVLRNKGYEAEFDDTARLANIEGALKFLEDAKSEIENFGPNPALIGTGVDAKSGRAIALMQQAGIAELGPYILAYRGWKIRVYRAIWNTVQRYWTGERWIRVTDDDDVAQFIQINGMTVGPDGNPALVNAIGELDVDIILDEGPDHVNMMADIYETLSNVVPAVAPLLDPSKAMAAVELLIETSPLPQSAKKRFREAGAEPSPEQQRQQQIQLAGAIAEVEETKSRALLNQAKAQEAMMPEAAPPMQMPEAEVPIPVQVAEVAANIKDKEAAAVLKLAQANKAQVEASLAPQKVAQDAEIAAANFRHQREMDTANFSQGIRDRDADRKIAAKKAAQKPAKRS